MNKVLRNLAFASLLLAGPALMLAQNGGAPPASQDNGGGRGTGGFQGGGQGGGQFGGGQGRGRGGRGSFVPAGPAGALAGRADIYNSTNGVNIVGKPTASGEHFFMIGSVDQAQQQLLLKWPTEVTLLLKITPDTKFSSESGKPLRLADFRAGDTVWVKYSGSQDNASAVSVRAGIMSVDDLHKYYLDYAVIK